MHNNHIALMGISSDNDDDAKLKCLFIKNICPTFIQIIEIVCGVTLAEIAVVVGGTNCRV
jgi:hypothetical protein